MSRFVRPIELLRKLPEWSVYIAPPGLPHPSGTPVEGSAASMNYTWDNDIVLYFVPFAQKRSFIPGFPLSEDLTIAEAVKKTVDDYHAMIGDMNLSKHGNRINPEHEISFVIRAGQSSPLYLPNRLRISGCSLRRWYR